MPRLIRVFAGRTFILCVLSRHGSFPAQAPIGSRITNTTVFFLRHGSGGLLISDLYIQNNFYILLLRFELPRDKTNKMVCAPSEDLEQPGHLLHLIRVFAVSSMGSWGSNVSSRGQQRLIRLGRCPGWSESSLGAKFILLVLTWGSSNVPGAWGYTRALHKKSQVTQYSLTSGSIGTNCPQTTLDMNDWTS